MNVSMYEIVVFIWDLQLQLSLLSYVDVNIIHKCPYVCYTYFIILLTTFVFVFIWVRKYPARLPMSIWLANWSRKYPPSHVSLSFWSGFSRESQAICPDIFCSSLLSLPIQRRLVFHPDYHCRSGGTSPYVSTWSRLVHCLVMQSLDIAAKTERDECFVEWCLLCGTTFSLTRLQVHHFNIFVW